MFIFLHIHIAIYDLLLQNIIAPYRIYVYFYAYSYCNIWVTNYDLLLKNIKEG